MTAFGPWTLEEDGALAVLTVSKPPLNLFDADVEDGLRAAVEVLSAAPPRGLLIRAEGKVWTGGVDVHVFAGLDPQQAAELWGRGFPIVHAPEDKPWPIVFAAHPPCLPWGLGVGLARGLLR